MERRDQVGRPEPRAQRQARPVHHGPGGDRRLPAARRANPQVPARLAADVPRRTARADEPLGPARREHVGAARFLGPEALLELQDRQREVRARHAMKLRNRPDGANPVRTSPDRSLTPRVHRRGTCRGDGGRGAPPQPLTRAGHRARGRPRVRAGARACRPAPRAAASFRSRSRPIALRARRAGASAGQRRPTAPAPTATAGADEASACAPSG